LFSAAGLNFALPSHLRVFPPIVPFLFVLLLSPIGVYATVKHKHKLARTIGHIDSFFLTILLLVSVGLVLMNLINPKGTRETPTELLFSAAALWYTNVLVFATWYWRIDAGGPAEREKRHQHEEGAFLFPQMTMTLECKENTCMEAWSPGFVDYLFLAFNASTALSPADTPVLTRWAKLLMMLQSCISLTIIVLMAARAVNILQ
jgi:uncharacterized membrane protein